MIADDLKDPLAWMQKWKAEKPTEPKPELTQDTHAHHHEGDVLAARKKPEPRNS